MNDKNASADIEHSKFSGNQAIGGSANGGAIGVTDGSTLTLEDSSFVANQAVGDSGADVVIGGGVGGAIAGGFGGAIAAEGFGFFDPDTFTAPTVNITSSSFTGNQAHGGDGGAGRMAPQGTAVRSPCRTRPRSL